MNYHTFNLNFIHFILLHVTLMVCFKTDFLLILLLLLLIIIIADLPTSHSSTAVVFCGWPKLMQILVKDFMEKSFCKHMCCTLSLSLKLCLCLSLSVCRSVCLNLSVCLSLCFLFIHCHFQSIFNDCEVPVCLLLLIVVLLYFTCMYNYRLSCLTVNRVCKVYLF